MVKEVYLNKDKYREDIIEDNLYEDRLAMNDILIYSSLSLEAYINYYAERYNIRIRKNPKRELSTVEKWKLYPKLKTGKVLNQNELKAIKNIFKLRNNIVHPKPDRIELETTQPYKGFGAQARVEKLDKEQLLINLNLVYEAIFKIDTHERDDHLKNPWLCDIKKLNR